MLNTIKKWKDTSGQQIPFNLQKYIRNNKSKSFVLRFKSGDKDAFSRVYKKFRKPILNYIVCKLRNRDIAEELTQEVFLKVYRFRESFDPQFEFSTWLWTIARNTLSDWFRKNRQASILEEGISGLSLDLEDVPSQNPNPEHVFIETADQEVLVQMMSVLTDLQKKALFMRLIHRLPYHEIASQLNLSLSAVKSVLHRARSTLLTQLPA